MKPKSKKRKLKKENPLLGRKLLGPGNVRWEVYSRVGYETGIRGRAVTAKEIIQGLGWGRKKGEKGLGIFYSQQLSVYRHLSDLTQEGYIRKVSRGLYTTADDHQKYEPAVLKDAIMLVLKHEGPQTAPDLAKRYDRTQSSVRATLHALKLEGRVCKEGTHWQIYTNVISLEEHRK